MNNKQLSNVHQSQLSSTVDSKVIDGIVISSKKKSVSKYSPGPQLLSRHQPKDSGYIPLCRIIKNITQQIGEYKKSRDPMAERYLIPALRNARSRVVADLESLYHITWEINPETGESVFYQ